MYFSKNLKPAIIVSLLACIATSAIAAPNLNSFFSSPQFDLPSLLKDIKFGMSEREIQKAIPAFRQKDNSSISVAQAVSTISPEMTAIDRVTVEGNEDIQVSKDMSYGSLYAIYIDLDTDIGKAVAFFQKKWGKAAINKTLLEEREYHWLSAEKGIRAQLERQSTLARLSYYQYIPIEKLFPQNVPSLPQPIADIKLGSSIENIKKISPDFRNKEFPDQNWTELKGYFNARIWYFSDNKSTIDYLSLSFPNIENVRAILVKKWGTPQKDSAGTEYWKNDNLEYIDAKGNPKKDYLLFILPNQKALIIV